MSNQEMCPCVNAKCPNHGKCDQCISRHLKIGHLNFCSFHTILPVLEEAIAMSPDSATAEKLDSLIKNTKETYAKLSAKNCIQEKDTIDRINKVKNYSAY